MIWHKAEDSAEKTKTIFVMEKEKKITTVHAFYTYKHSYKPSNELTASYFLCIFLFMP